MTFSLVVAADREGGIGKNNDLPWRLPEDLKQFKKITTTTVDPIKQNVVIMGRKTWASLPTSFRPLPQRINVILTRDRSKQFDAGVFSCGSFDEALDLSDQLVEKGAVESVFVIGGGALFHESIGHAGCKKVYLTEINGIFKCDTFFPVIPSSFKVIEESEKSVNMEVGLEYQFKVYARSSNP